MGLKTTNYISKSTGVPLVTAYAILKNLRIESNNTATATFFIHQTREMTDVYHPLDTVKVHFIWDRKRNPVEQAYEAAKSQMIMQVIETETDEFIEEQTQGVLYGWSDDIV